MLRSFWLMQARKKWVTPTRFRCKKPRRDGSLHSRAHTDPMNYRRARENKTTELAFSRRLARFSMTRELYRGREKGLTQFHRGLWCRLWPLRAMWWNFILSWNYALPFSPRERKFARLSSFRTNEFQGKFFNLSNDFGHLHISQHMRIFAKIVQDSN